MHLRLHTSMLMVHVKNIQFEVCSWQVADFEGLYFIGQVCHGELNAHFQARGWRHCFQLGTTISIVASPILPIGDPKMLITINFYDGNVICMVWNDKLDQLQYN